MSTVVFGVLGTWGDLFPAVGVATELRRRGHAVAVATGRVYRPIVEEAGLAFAPIEWFNGPEQLAAVPSTLTTRRGGFSALQAMCDSFLGPHLADTVSDLRSICRGADLLVGHPVLIGGSLAAQLEGVRLATACVTPPWIPSKTSPPAGTMPLFADGDPALAWERTIRQVDALVDPLVNDVQRTLGLPATEHTFFDPLFKAELVMLMSSPVVYPPPPDWPAHVVMTGTVSWDRASTIPPDPRLERFLSEGEPPVVVGLGGSASLDPQGIYEQLAEAIVAQGCRGVLLSGPRPQGGAITHRDVLVLSFASSSTLFPRSRAVVHHSGAGTMLMACRAGKPQLCLPRAFDQAWTASRFADLGAGLVVPWRQAVCGAAAPALTRLLHDPSYADAAARVASAMADEDGEGTAADMIEALLRQ